MKHTIFVSRRYNRQIRRVPRRFVADITARIDQLAKEPHPTNPPHVITPDGNYEVEVHGYWIEYSVDDDQKIIKILGIGP